MSRVRKVYSWRTPRTQQRKNESREQYCALLSNTLWVESSGSRGVVFSSGVGGEWGRDGQLV